MLKYIFDRSLPSVAGICQPCVIEIATERRQGPSAMHLTCGTCHLGKLTVSSTKHLNCSQSRVAKQDCGVHLKTCYSLAYFETRRVPLWYS